MLVEEKPLLQRSSTVGLGAEAESCAAAGSVPALSVKAGLCCDAAAARRYAKLP